MQLPSHGAHTTEYITVTQGTLILRHENKELKLACGDSACLCAGGEYTWQNMGDGQAQMSVVMTVS